MAEGGVWGVCAEAGSALLRARCSPGDKVADIPCARKGFGFSTRSRLPHPKAGDLKRPGAYAGAAPPGTRGSGSNGTENRLKDLPAVRRRR